MELHSKETNALLALLSYELFDRGLDGSFEDVDFFKVIAFANRHAVTPLLYSGIGKIEGVDPVAFDLVERYAVRSTVYFDRMAQVQSEIIDLLKGADARCAVLKGMSVAALYRHPEVRTTGDIDILVEERNMDACRDAMVSAGYIFEGRNEIHMNFKKGRAAVEIHEKVSSYPDTEKGKFCNSFMSGALEHVRIKNIGVHAFPVLEDKEQLIALLSHTERHLGASGIGLRQLCDWAIAVSHVDADNADEIIETLKNCGLYVFACALTGVAEKFLGLSECAWMESVSEELIDETMEEILSAGNFQAQYKNRPKASAFIDPYDLDGDGKRRIIRTYLRKVKRKMAAEFPWAKSRAWIPVFGVYYAVWLAVSVLRGKIDGKGMMNTLKTSKKREKYLRKLCLYK